MHTSKSYNKKVAWIIKIETNINTAFTKAMAKADSAQRRIDVV